MGGELNPLRIGVSLLALLAAMLPLANNAMATPAGSVLFVKGPVTAERSPSVALVKGDEILVKDTIVTGVAGRAQLLMLDGAKIAIRPNSRFSIEEYQYTPPPGGTGGAVVSTSGDRSVTSLIKGGFRTITGAIGKADETAYELRTPVGVLGVRGTDYTAVFCRADCEWAPGVSASDPLEDGLYLGVLDGTIFFRNELGQFDLSAGEYAFIAMADRRLRKLDKPPGVFMDDVQLSDADDASEGTQLRFDGVLGTRREPRMPALEEDGSEKTTDEPKDPPAQPILGIDADGNVFDLTPGSAPPEGSRTIGFSIGSLDAQGVPLASAQDNAPGEYQTDLSNNVTGFAGAYPPVLSPQAGQYGLGTTTQANTGFDSLTVFRWDRWSGGTVDINLRDGTDVSQDLGNQSLHSGGQVVRTEK